MASWYIRSGAGGTASGADWTNAKLTIAAAITASSAGDTFYVADDHAETQASALTLTFKGTVASPDKCLCVNRAGTVPPVSADLRTSATVTTTGNNGIALQGSVYVYGISFVSGSGANSPNATLFNTGSQSVMEACNLTLGGTSGGSVSIATAGAKVTWINTTFTTNNASHQIRVSGGVFIWRNTASALPGGTLPTSLFANNGAYAQTLVEGVDLSALGSGKTLFSTGGSSPGLAIAINCKLGASVTVAATPTSPALGQVDLQISDSGTAQYRQERYAYQGTLTSETVVVPSSQQASEGTTPITWKVVTTANTKWQSPFESFAFGEENVTTGGALTRTFEIINDGTTLTNADIWVEAQYLGSSATPVTSLATTGTADILAAGSNITTSTATWTTTGISSPTKQKIAVSFTPQMVGVVRYVLKVAKTSKTIWFNPRPNEK